MATGTKHWEQDKEATVYVGNLDERVTDALVWELMLQAGRIVNVHLPKDRVTQTHQGYGFVEFISEDDAEYAAKIMNQVRLYGKPIRVNKASADKQKTVDVGAELFVGNLDSLVDEKTLYDTFSRFGTLVVPPKVARDDANISKGYGFVSFSNFESSDEAIANMHGQFLANKEITVQYAYKKDGKGERHGDAAERLLASQAREHNVEVPTQQGMQGLFNPNQVPLGGAVQAPQTPMAPGMNGGYNAPPGFGNGVPPPQSPYGQAPMPMHAQMGRPGIVNTPLPPAPAGLPARPPPSLGGYGGPPGGYQQQAPPGFAPPGFAPNAPPGFQQQPPYGNGMPPGFGR